MRADASAVARSMRPMWSRSPDFLTTLARSSSHRARRDDHVATHLFRISNRFGAMPNSRISSGGAIQRLFQIHTERRARKGRTARGPRLPAYDPSRVRLGKTARLPRWKPIASAQSRPIPVSCLPASPARERLHTARRSRLRRRASLCVHPRILTVGPRRAVPNGIRDLRFVLPHAIRPGNALPYPAARNGSIPTKVRSAQYGNQRGAACMQSPRIRCGWISLPAGDADGAQPRPADRPRR